MIKDLKYYTELPYTIEVTPLLEAEGGGFNACIPLLGRFALCSCGETHQEAIDSLLGLLNSRIKYYLKNEITIPEPQSLTELDAQYFADAKRALTRNGKIFRSELFKEGELPALTDFVKSLPELPDDSDESDPDPVI